MSGRAENVRFLPDDIQQVRRSTFLRSIEYHPTLGSTNTRALELSSDPALEVPSLVLTDQQTAGRGRGANCWQSAPGALTFSVILNRSDAECEWGWTRVSLVAGLAVCAALRQLCPSLQIGLKWPNDVFICTRKVCGILVEVPPRLTARLVVGFGVNVNNRIDASQLPQATSLVDELGYTLGLPHLLVAILEQLPSHTSLLSNRNEELMTRWRSYCMLTGSTVRIQMGKRQKIGVCRGIDVDGALLIETERGTESCVTGIVSVLQS